MDMKAFNVGISTSIKTQVIHMGMLRKLYTIFETDVDKGEKD